MFESVFLDSFNYKIKKKIVRENSEKKMKKNEITCE